MLAEEPDDAAVAENAVSELQDVVPLVLEDEIVDVFPCARSCSTRSRDSCSTTRGSFWPWITSSGAVISSMRVRGERSTRKSRSRSGSPIVRARYRLPGLGDPLAEREQVVRAEHVDRRPPQVGMAPREGAASCSRRTSGRPRPRATCRRARRRAAPRSSRGHGRAGRARPSHDRRASCSRARSPSSRARSGTNTAKPSSVRIWISGIENQAKLGRSWLCGPPWT